MGSWLLRSSFSPALNVGVIFAILIVSGSKPFANEILKIYWNDHKSHQNNSWQHQKQYVVSDKKKVCFDSLIKIGVFGTRLLFAQGTFQIY